MQTNGDWRHYLSDIGVISYDRTNKHKINYFHKDRLGSAITFSDHNGQLVNRRSFDAFGKPRGGFDGSTLTQSTLNENDTQATTNFITNNRRGFTTHEHLDGAEIIHMNGRVYDYNLGRFMSVDPLIQSPTNSQSLNPYSYIMNNPLSGIDPSGYCAVGMQSTLRCSEGGPLEDSSKDCTMYCVPKLSTEEGNADEQITPAKQDVGEQVAGSEGNGISRTSGNLQQLLTEGSKATTATGVAAYAIVKTKGQSLASQKGGVMMLVLSGTVSNTLTITADANKNGVLASIDFAEQGKNLGARAGVLGLLISAASTTERYINKNISIGEAVGKSAGDSLMLLSSLRMGGHGVAAATVYSAIDLMYKDGVIGVVRDLNQGVSATSMQLNLQPVIRPEQTPTEAMGDWISNFGIVRSGVQ